MIVHKVKAGECLSTIAHRSGFKDWRQIYFHQDNQELRRKRTNPHLLLPGDRVNIPDTVQKNESGGAEQRHRFLLSQPKTVLRLVIQDDLGSPLASARYVLSIPDSRMEGETDAEGMLEASIDTKATEGQLELWPEGTDSGARLVWPLKIGHLDPIDTVSGIQARLQNFGYPCGTIDGIIGPLTKSATREFQVTTGLQNDGIPGPQTQAKLAQQYGC